jgi:hypothetical protein
MHASLAARLRRLHALAQGKGGHIAARAHQRYVPPMLTSIEMRM